MLVKTKERKDQKGVKALGVLVAHYSITAALQPEVIIPIPLHWIRHRLRGYNQAYLLAHAVHQVHTAALLLEPFRRHKATSRQQALGKELRKTNVHGAFSPAFGWSEEALATALRNKRVVIVDDVYTTGATMHALIALISHYKPASIQVLVACRA